MFLQKGNAKNKCATVSWRSTQKDTTKINIRLKFYQKVLPNRVLHGNVTTLIAHIQTSRDLWSINDGSFSIRWWLQKMILKPEFVWGSVFRSFPLSWSLSPMKGSVLRPVARSPWFIDLTLVWSAPQQHHLTCEIHSGAGLGEGSSGRQRCPYPQAKCCQKAYPFWSWQ